jgi:hypothetical protein
LCRLQPDSQHIGFLCKLDTVTSRNRTLARPDHPMRRGTDLFRQRQRASRKPSGHGFANRHQRNAEPRSTITAIALSAFTSKRSRGTMPTLRRYSSA